MCFIVTNHHYRSLLNHLSTSIWNAKRKLEFCHYETWASLVCHPIKGIHSFAIIKLDTLAGIPFYPPTMPA